MKIGRLWRVEVLVPALILAALILDATGRFVRLEPLAFRADEAVSQFRSYWRPGPFEPDLAYRNDRSTGDLAVISSRPQYRVFREQRYTTDDLGFRNVGRRRDEVPSILMFGTSFTAGTGNSDDQTLPVRVEAHSGCRVYNAGNIDPRSDTILRVASQLGMRKGLVIIEALERYAGIPVPPRRGRMKWLPFREDLMALQGTLFDRLSISPLKVVLQRAYKSLQDDRILPNIHKDGVAVRHLQDGSAYLFLKDLEKPRLVAGIIPDADRYAQVRDDLRSAGFELAVVIVPEKLTVYRQLLREPVPERTEDVGFLGSFEVAIRAREIPVFNLTTVLTDRAKAAFARGETLYWADDTHWNPEGIDIAASAICDALELKSRCGGVTTPPVP